MRAMSPLLLILPLLAGAGLTDGEMESLAAKIQQGTRAEVDQALNQITFAGAGSFMTPRLIQLMSSSSENGRANAAYALGFVGDSRAAASLSRALSDPEVSVRASAATACGRLKLADTGPALSKALSDKASGVRREAANAVGIIGYRKAVKPLLALISDPDLEIKAIALLAVGRLGSPEAIPRLREAENDTSETVHFGAMRALGMLGDRKAREEIKTQMGSPDAEKRRDAVGLIGEVRKDWSSALLVSALSDTSPEVRLAAARALGQAHDERGLRYLVLASAAATDPEEKLRIEHVLEDLQVTPEMRAKLLAKNGKKDKK
jgi:HEAT repeat protein